ncbi:Leishmanolysin [Trypanosoma cruzi]|uniref:Leishmanolysin-like peptidase n=1 Tax=Trypanosoma cruzi TaxID=5693 RepID=A0A7J6Y641_TRYCR|nr:Leishmanolysin [Trypanosoma cruzi]
MAVQSLAPCTFPRSFISRPLATRIAAHLMTHVLGFNCLHMASRSMLGNVVCVRGRALLVVVDSANATMAARERHDCDDIVGMELQEDDGDGRTLESYWSQRHAKDEWMAPIGGAGDCTELTLAASAALGCMRVKWEMAEPMRWSRNSGCELLQRRYPTLKMGKYPYRFCESGVPLKCCASDRYSSGWCLGSIHEISAKRPMDSCPIIDPALDARDIDAVIWRENICLQGLGISPLRGVRTRFPRTRQMRGTRRRHI